MNDRRAEPFSYHRRSRRPGARVPGFLAVLWFAISSAIAREPRLLTQYYLVNEPSSVQSVQSHYGRMSVVSPPWFTVDEKGNVESRVDSGIVDWAAGKGVPLMPLVVNQKFLPAAAHALLYDSSLQGQVIGRIAEVAAGNHFFGIQFDFENIPAEDRDRYSEFVRRAAGEFRRRHLKLSVAVVAPLAPPPVAEASAPPASAGWITNPHSLAFDYRSIANDVYFISLMTYDEYGSAQQPGPVAGRPWVEACLRQTLEFVPAKKLLLGIPLYYREWFGKSVIEGSMRDAQDLAQKWSAKIAFDPEQHEAYFTYSDGHEQHSVWLQDDQSIRERVELADQYHLAGISAWRMGFDDDTTWDNALPKTVKRIR